LVASALIMPLGFFAVLAGEQMQSVGIVVVGTVVFGLMHGIAYFASLHYAMVVENASVEAGGMHEAVIGLSFALGPAVALLGYATGNMHYGLVPLIVLCIIAALVPLWRSLRC